MLIDITKIKKLEKEVETYKCRLINIERDLNIQQQRDRLCNIEISGIPEKNNDDLRQILLSICMALDAQATKQDHQSSGARIQVHRRHGQKLQKIDYS